MGTLPFDPPVLTWSSTLVTWPQHGTWQARQLLPHTKGLFGAKCIESCQQSSMKIRLTTCISITTHCCLKFASQGRISKVGLFREIFSVWIYFFCCREIIIQCTRMELQQGKKILRKSRIEKISAKKVPVRAGDFILFSQWEEEEQKRDFMLMKWDKMALSWVALSSGQAGKRVFFTALSSFRF